MVLTTNFRLWKIFLVGSLELCWQYWSWACNIEGNNGKKTTKVAFKHVSSWFCTLHRWLFILVSMEREWESSLLCLHIHIIFCPIWHPKMLFPDRSLLPCLHYSFSEKFECMFFVLLKFLTEEANPWAYITNPLAAEQRCLFSRAMPHVFVAYLPPS